jgi:hypothetical protein
MLVIKEIGQWQKSDKVDFRYRIVKIKTVAQGMKSFGGKANRGLEFTVVAWEQGTTFTVKETGESLGLNPCSGGLCSLTVFFTTQ